jgi:hypothetical protein
MGRKMKKSVKRRTKTARRRLKTLHGLGQIDDALFDGDYEVTSNRPNNPYLYDTCLSILENISNIAQGTFSHWVWRQGKSPTEFPSRLAVMVQPKVLFDLDRMDPGTQENVKRMISLLQGGGASSRANADRCVHTKPTPKALAGLGVIRDAAFRNLPMTRLQYTDALIPGFELQLALAKRDVEQARTNPAKCMRAFHSAADAVWKGSQLWVLNGRATRQDFKDDLLDLDRTFRAACVS